MYKNLASKLRFIFLLSILFSSSLVAKTQYKPVLKVGVLYWSMNIPGQVAMRIGFENEAKQINTEAEKHQRPKVELIPFVAGDGKKGIENQIQQMLQLIKQKVDIIIVQPTDNAALAIPLRKANKAKIPVVAYDQYISGGKMASFVTSNNRQAGFLDGEYIASKFSNKYTIKLILVEYPHVSSTVERLNGFLDALNKMKQAYKILKTYKAVHPNEGKQAGLKILNDFPVKNSIDVIFTVNDGGGLSLVDELVKAGRTEIITATVDGDPASISNIKNNRLTQIDSAQFCGPLGAQAIKVAYNILQGKKVKSHILVPVFPVTKETLSIYPGWLGPIPAAFTKPWKSNNPIWDGNN